MTLNLAKKKDLSLSNMLTHAAARVPILYALSNTHTHTHEKQVCITSPQIQSEREEEKRSSEGRMNSGLSLLSTKAI